MVVPEEIHWSGCFSPLAPPNRFVLGLHSGTSVFVSLCCFDTLAYERSFHPFGETKENDKGLQKDSATAATADCCSVPREIWHVTW